MRERAERERTPLARRLKGPGRARSCMKRCDGGRGQEREGGAPAVPRVCTVHREKARTAQVVNQGARMETPVTGHIPGRSGHSKGRQPVPTQVELTKSYLNFGKYFFLSPKKSRKALD